MLRNLEIRTLREVVLVEVDDDAGLTENHREDPRPSEIPVRKELQRYAARSKRTAALTWSTLSP